jgi:hypothetical protein
MNAVPKVGGVPFTLSGGKWYGSADKAYAAEGSISVTFSDILSPDNDGEEDLTNVALIKDVEITGSNGIIYECNSGSAPYCELDAASDAMGFTVAPKSLDSVKTTLRAVPSNKATAGAVAYNRDLYV